MKTTFGKKPVAVVDSDGKLVGMFSGYYIVQNGKVIEDHEPLIPEGCRVVDELPPFVDHRDYKEKRKDAYPDIGDQLDAILKSFKYLSENGTDIPVEMQEIINKWLLVKQNHPREG